MVAPIPTLPQLDQLASTLIDISLADWRLPTAIERKPDGSLVTPVDKAANRAAAEWARGYDIGFVGEEGADAAINQDYVLYVDPLDGTSTYIAGKPEFSVVITLMKRTESGLYWKPELCVIAEPATGRRYFADRNSVYTAGQNDWTPTRLNPLGTHHGPSHVSVITWRNVPFRLGAVRNSIEKDDRFHHHGCGNTGINGPLIALGSIHGVVYAGNCATEAAAISLMVHAAGGTVTNLFGAPLTRFKLKEVAGKLDFELPCGMIAATSSAVAKLLSDLVKTHQ